MRNFMANSFPPMISPAMRIKWMVLVESILYKLAYTSYGFLCFRKFIQAEKMKYVRHIIPCLQPHIYASNLGLVNKSRGITVEYLNLIIG